MKPNRPILVLTLLSAVLLGGCNSLDGSRDVGHYVVSVPQTPIFRYGPAQSFGPDFNLKQNQHVVVLRREYGYSRIMTDDGQTGYVATEDLTPAPPPAKPTPTSSRDYAGRLPARGTYRPGISSANNRIIESGPLFDPGLPPLPEHEPVDAGPAHHKPEDKKSDEKKSDSSKPDFRYPKPRPGFRVNVPTPDPTTKP